MAVLGTDKYASSVWGSVMGYIYGVPGKVAWMVQVDWDNDGTWGAEIESQDIRHVKFKRGREGRMRGDGNGQNHPDGESFDIEIRDVAGKYDVFNSGSEIYDRMGHPGLLLRILIVDTTTKAQAEPVFVGTLTGIDWDADMGWGRLSGTGLSRYLELGAAAEVVTEPQDWPATDPTFIEGGGTPYPFNYWKGRADGLKMDECFSLFCDTIGYPFGFETGAVVSEDEPDFMYFRGETGWTIVTDLADAFGASIFFLRDGKLFARDLLDIPMDIPSGVSVGPYAGAQRKLGITKTKPFESLFTRADVAVNPILYHPYVAGFGYPPFSNDHIGWENGGPIVVPPSTTIFIETNFDGKDGYLMAWGGPYWVFQGYIDQRYEAWSNPDRSGIDMSFSGTGVLSIGPDTELGEIYGPDKQYKRQDRTRIYLKNRDTVKTAYVFDLKVGVVGIYRTGNKIFMGSSDADGISLNGDRKITINNWLVQNTVMAENLGKKYLAVCSTRDRASVSWLGYHANGDGIVDLLTGYDVGTVVNFGAQGGETALANYGVYGKRLIVGQEVEWMDTSGQNLMARLCFERLPILQVEINGVVSTETMSFESSMAWSHTVSTGDDQVLLVAVAERGWSWVTSITYGGVALTKLDSISLGIPTNGDRSQVEMWYLVNPSVGTANIVLTTDKVDWVEAGAMTLKNVDTSDPFGARTKDKDYTGVISLDVACDKCDLVVDVCGAWDSSAPTMGDGQTPLWSETSDGSWRGFGSSKPGSFFGTVNMGWSVVADATHGWAAIGVAVKGRNDA